MQGSSREGAERRGKSLDLTAADCDFNGYIPRTLRFTATVTLRDGMGEAAASAAAVFEY